ncbi:MAG: pyridine nucleotide-disulfide oxidoreductase [Herpetosiphonaceae bacterium]|nr:MAG: pyridine nucleotide-disulfide oxidoreductase [Herpetosiphonaceae bacterium]
MKRVVIVGMGFGGLEAARALAGKGLDVLVLDRQNYHLFQPLLYQVATATLEAPSIAYPIRSIIRNWPGVRFQMTEVKGVDLDARQVITEEESIPYDYLILAVGSVTNFFGMESVKQSSYDLKRLADATALRNHILTMYERAAQEDDPEKRKALMTFVVVGGGPTGVEFSGALAELARWVLVKDYPELHNERPRIILLEAMDRILAPFSEDLQRYALHRLKKIGVEVRLNTALAGAEPDKVYLKDGTVIPAYTLFWAAGVRAHPLAEALPVPKAKAGRIPVQQDLTIAGYPEVYVIGDLAYFEQDGAPLPMLAPVAMQMGRYAGQAIVKRERGERMRPFRYSDRGTMAVIGRNAAIAEVFGRRFSGFVAWLIWLALHLAMLVGFRNRLLTLINWGYDYLLFERQIRLITRQERERQIEASLEQARSA